MSRLIDADETLQKKWGVEIKDMFHMTETVEVVSAIDIEKAPTVKAIPVEWIEKFMNRFRLGMVTSDEYALLHFMLTEWENENEISAMPVSDNSTISLDYLGERK